MPHRVNFDNHKRQSCLHSVIAPARFAQKSAQSLTMAVSEEVANLCRLCMNPNTTEDMTEIFQEQENSSVFSMKIMTCFSVEVFMPYRVEMRVLINTVSLLPFQVHKTDQLPKQMCPPCVYQLEKFYIFRKVCRKTDTKYRSFLRKLKSKKIQRLDELSDDDAGYPLINALRWIRIHPLSTE